LYILTDILSRSIAKQFETEAQKLSFSADDKSEGSLEIRNDISPAMQYVDKVEGWNTETDGIHDPNMPLASDTGEEEPVFSMVNESWSPGEDRMSELVIDSRAYQWLLAKMWNEFELEFPAETTTPSLSEAIFRNLNERQQFSRKSTPRRVHAVFDADWSPHSFLRDQEYGVPPEEAVVKALVLVGTITQAEGLACGEYLLRQWPESALAFIQLIQSVVKSTQGILHNGTGLFFCKYAELTLMFVLGKLGDDTKLQAVVKDGRFILTACGHPDSIIEIGEQLMWISCALRSSSFTQVGICEPYFREISTTNRSDLCISMHIELAVMPKLPELGESKSGACWKRLFQNTLVVGCHPISHRCSEPVLGLQLSLSTLMSLVLGSRLVSYMGRLFVKTFSTLLVAVKLVNNVIVWHAISNKDGSYIYYHDKRIDTLCVEVTSSLLQEVDIADLRHVIGWTSKAENLAGSHSPSALFQDTDVFPRYAGQ
jgi:hypothetical protein